MITQSWLLPASICLVVWGFWSFLPKLILRYIDPMSALLYEVAGAILVAVVVLLLLKLKPSTNIQGAGLAIATGMLGAIGSLAFIYAVKVGKVSVVTVFAAMYPLVTISLAYLVLHETVSFKEGLGMAFAFAAIILFSV